MIHSRLDGRKLGRGAAHPAIDGGRLATAESRHQRGDVGLELGGSLERIATPEQSSSH